MRELNKNAWVFEMTVDESCKNIDDMETQPQQIPSWQTQSITQTPTQ